MKTTVEISDTLLQEVREFAAREGDFRREIAFVKFIGTHAEYDRIDALTASQF